MEYVLITGATSGIGKEFALLYGARHNNLILIGRDLDKLEKLKAAVELEYGVQVVIVVLDLARREATEQLRQFIAECGLDIALVINNAGIATAGRAQEISSKDDYEMIMVNVYSLIEITKIFLDYFYDGKRGCILNVASTGAFTPGPYTASYFASKSFVLSYTKAVNHEARAYGVYVGALCPGTTRTALFDKSNQKCPRWAMDPAKVARIGARQIERRKVVQICGRGNWFLVKFPEAIKTRGIAAIKRQAK